MWSVLWKCGIWEKFSWILKRWQISKDFKQTTIPIFVNLWWFHLGWKSQYRNYKKVQVRRQTDGIGFLQQFHWLCWGTNLMSLEPEVADRNGLQRDRVRWQMHLALQGEAGQEGERVWVLDLYQNHQWSQSARLCSLQAPQVRVHLWCWQFLVQRSLSPGWEGGYLQG